MISASLAEKHHLADKKLKSIYGVYAGMDKIEVRPTVYPLRKTS